MLKRCDYVFARGSETARNLETLPKVRNWKEAADITFLYEPEFTLSQENEARLEPVLAELEEIKAQGNKIAIFCPSSLVDKKTTEIGIDYVGQMLQLVQVLIEKNVHCVFVPNSNRQHTTKPTNNDIVVITKVKEAIQADPRLQSSKEITLIDFDINTQAIRRLFSLADILIASRFHAMISGLALGKPTLVIGWGHKYHETMAAFGQAEFEVRFNKANENLSGLVMDQLARQADIEKTLHQRLEQEKASAMVQFEYLKKRLS